MCGEKPVGWASDANGALHDECILFSNDRLDDEPVQRRADESVLNSNPSMSVDRWQLAYKRMCVLYALKSHTMRQARERHSII